MIEITEVLEYKDDVLNTINLLLVQLSKSAPALSEQHLREIIESPASKLLVASKDGKLVGSLTLVVFRIPTGVRAWIEDVVVNFDYRGEGIGQALVSEAVRIAQVCGARTVDLTSRPDRDAANQLYRKAGFAQRDTNVYRFGNPESGPQ